MAEQRAMLYKDYITLRDAKVGDTVVLSNGRKIKKRKLTDSEACIGTHQRPSSYRNLDSYDNTYV